MRKLMWFTVGFAAAIALAVWLLNVNFLIFSVLAGTVCALIAGKLGIRRLAVLCLGCSIGFGWYFVFSESYLSHAHALDTETIETDVTATDYSFKTDYGIAVDGEFTRDGKTYKVRLYMENEVELNPGDTITGSFKLRYTAPGGKREATHHAGEKILFLAYERGSARIHHSPAMQAKYFAIYLRQSICEVLERCFPADVVPFAQALLLGMDYDLDYETDTALKISGIRHVIAVSGLHVAILYTMLRAVSLNRRWLTALIGFPTLALFCAVAGFTPSVTRACIMVSLMMLAQLLNKEYDSATALSFAVLVMLFLNPLVITSISFQMSVACVAGILLFRERISQWLQSKIGVPREKNLKSILIRWFISSVGISLSAMSLTVPMSAYYFGTVSLVGVLTNLLTLWAVSLGFYGIVTVCIVSLIWVKGAAILAFLTAIPMRCVLWMAKLLSRFPLAAVYTASPYIVLWIIFVYVLLAVFLLSPNRKPGVLLCCAVLMLCLALLVSWTEHTFSDTHFTALDVGQGQCLILHQDGKTFLIDCGGSNDKIVADTAAETLLSRGITHLDGIILTHGDRDHAGGIPHLLTRIHTGFLMLPSTTGQEIVAELTEHLEGELILAGSDMEVTLNSANITVFGPTFAAESNENSLCILFEGKKCAILITGDRSRMGELLLMRDASLPDVDLLIAGHHGSKYSTSEELLNTVTPETVFISVGRFNGYGHPAEELLARLISFDCDIYRTDLSGTLIYRR